MRARRRSAYRWLNLLLFFAGVALMALAYWLDVRDGVPSTRREGQPFEVTVAGGLGIIALGNGLYRFWKSFKSDDEQTKG